MTTPPSGNDVVAATPRDAIAGVDAAEDRRANRPDPVADPFLDALDNRTVRRRLEASERRIERLQHELAQLTDWREQSRKGARPRLMSGLLGILPAWIALALATASAAIVWRDHRQLADLALQLPPPGAEGTSGPTPPAAASERASEQPMAPAQTPPSRTGLPTLRRPVGTPQHG